MNGRSDKFLVTLVNGLTHKQIFFAIWAAIVFGFVMLMYSYYRKTQERNFRSLSDGPGPKIRVDARQLGGGKKNDLVVKKAAPPTKR